VYFNAIGGQNILNSTTSDGLYFFLEADIKFIVLRRKMFAKWKENCQFCVKFDVQFSRNFRL
jgi:hypothetical protein